MAINTLIGIKRAGESVEAFSAKLAAFSDFIEDEVTDVTQHIALFAWHMIVDFTPKLTGRAKNAWNLSYDMIDHTVPNIGSYSAPIPPTLRGPEAEFNVVFVTSSLNYMGRLEEGHSAKGSRMIEKTQQALEFAIPTIIGGRQNV